MSRIRPPSLPAKARPKLFVSHSWRYSDDRQGIHELLQQKWRKGEDFVDLAVPADHPIHDADDDAQLFDKLRDRISRSHVLLVLGGMYANNSAWIETEVTIARAIGIPVVTVVPYGQERIASAATRFENDRVRWRGDSIREAVLAHAPAALAAEIEARMKAREQEAAATIFLALYPQSPSLPGRTILTSALAPVAMNRRGPPPVRTNRSDRTPNKLRSS